MGAHLCALCTHGDAWVLWVRVRSGVQMCGPCHRRPLPKLSPPLFPPPISSSLPSPPLHPGAVVPLWVVGTRGCPQGAHEGAVLVTPAHSAGVALGTVVSPQWFVSPPLGGRWVQVVAV